MGKFFFAASIAFIQVENLHLKRFIRRLQTYNANYEPPCRITLGSTILDKVHNSIVEKKKEILKGTDGVLLADGWRNKSSNRKYLVFSVRNLNTPQTFLTFFDISIEREDAVSLQENIDAAIQIARDKYDCNSYAFVSDNDFKIVAGAKLAKDGTLTRSSCSSHSANLLIKIFVTPELIKKLRTIITVYREPKMEALYMGRGGSKLTNFPDTRFCYLRDTCKGVLKNLNHLQALSTVSDMNVRDKIIEILFDDGFKQQLTFIVEHLNPICVLKNKCQSPDCNVANSTELWLSLKLPTNNYDINIAERIQKAVYPVGYAANLLHQKYRGRLMNENQRNKADTFLNEYLNDEAKAELINYLNTNENYQIYAERLDDPIAFWLYMQNKNYFPHLADAALKLMIIPASTAALEGLFSNWTYVHNLYRNRLGDVKSSNLLDIYYFLKNALFDRDLIDEIMVIEDNDQKDDDRSNSDDGGMD